MIHNKPSSVPPDEKTCTVFLGPPGCGKGTSSKHVQAEIGVPRLDMGAQLRWLKQNSTDPATHATLAELNSGPLTPDEFIVSQVQEWMCRSEVRGARAILFDGAIRTRPQLDALAPFIAKEGFRLRVLWLKAESLKVYYDRIINAPREGRLDDRQKSAVLARFAAYAKETRHLLPIFKGNGFETYELDNTRREPAETRHLALKFVEETLVAA